MNVIAHIGGTPPASPPLSRASSESNILRSQPRPRALLQSNDAGAGSIASLDASDNMVARRMEGASYTTASEMDEKTPLLRDSGSPFPEAQKSRSWLLPQRVAEIFVGSFKFLMAPIVCTGQFLVACFYDEDGRFSLIAPVYHIGRLSTRARRKKRAAAAMQSSNSANHHEKSGREGRLNSTAHRPKRSPRRSTSAVSSSTVLTSDSEMESEHPPTREEEHDSPSRHTRSKSSASSTTEEIAPAKRQIRIKLHSDDALRQRKNAKKSPSQASSKGGPNQVSAEAAAALKSPTGPITSKQLTKFPRAPQPPRPLVPRRQPSYSAAAPASLGPHQKTLIIDLDETLIHSMAKGGRYTTGHMVEVKLQQPVGAGGQIIGPQVPILYYVHKRPHCDEFLKKVPRPVSAW